MRRSFITSAFLALAASASAQSPVSPGWSALSGCWIPIPSDARVVAPSNPRACVLPTGTNSAELVTIIDDRITERTRIDADGQRHEVSKQGCTGWESASFSADGRRLYLQSEQSCIGGMTRKTSGVFALASDGDWINAVNVSADSANSLRVTRYKPAVLTTTMPAEVRNALEAREVSDRTSRMAAQSMVGTNAVIEASKFLNAPVTEAWLAELDQDFNLDEKTLIRLADAGVPPSVIDVMVAVSNPEVFDVRATGSGIAATESDSMRLRRQARYNDCSNPIIDPWAYYAYDPCDPYHRYSYYRSRAYRNGYGYGYDRYAGYGAYDPYGYNYRDYGPPVVIIVRGSASDPALGRGRMTKDGYRRDDGTPARGTGERSGTSTATTSTTSKGESRPATESTTGSSSSGSSGRTATRKPPAD
ncbi:MAG: hypothetical protein ABIR92_01520 [Gemmatimonadaceae bacterium]